MNDIYLVVQLLVCLRILIRRCVYETVNKDDIQNLFPAEVLPELQRLLTLLLQKFHREWHDDVLKDQVCDINQYEISLSYFCMFVWKIKS